MKWITILILTGLFAWSITANQASVIESPHGDFDEECSLCHGQSAWKPIQLRDDFDHGRYGPKLVGRHEGLYCGFCHVSLDFKGLDGGCASCHVDAHAGELGPDCAQCHGFESFASTQDQFRMHRGSSFPLSGAHLGIACDRCHPQQPEGAATYRLTDARCVSCHQDDFDSVITPDHVGAGFDQDCERCHRISQWDDARFDHSRIGAALCVDCHQDDYDGTRDPVHVDLGFSTTCQDCHNTIDWRDARFDHDGWFPIYSGRHRDLWDRCSRCHVDSGDYLVFTCLSCHPHSDQRETDDHHKEVQDYAYDSVECYRCHPTGRNP